MRHRRKTKRLHRTTSHRIATLRNLVRSLFLAQLIKTTRVKAKEARSLADKLITVAKRGSPSSQRLAFSILPDKEIIKLLFKEIAPRFKNRLGGYTRVIPLNFRKGDGADLAILELTEKKMVEKAARPEKKHPKAEEKQAPPKEKLTAKPPKTEEREAAGPKIAAKPKMEVAEEIAKERAKTEEKKIQKGFMKGLRRFFRGKAP